MAKPTCTPGERKMLDFIQKSDAVFAIAPSEGDGPLVFRLMRHITNPPYDFTVEYGHPDGKTEPGVVRRVKVTMGITQKRFDAAMAKTPASSRNEAT